MALLVGWDMVEFALQPVRRPFLNEVMIAITTLLVLASLLILRSSRARMTLTATILSLPQCLFGLLGIYASPTTEGFGKWGPGVAAILSGVAVIYAFLAYREERKRS